MRRVAHRDWPLPEGPWLMAATWENLLFCHWPVSTASLDALVPQSLDVDTYEGRGWVGIVALRLRGVRLHGLLPPPILSTFPALNVRTYVTAAGRPGIFFLSLDAPSGLAVAVAKGLYRLPYFRARMSMTTEDDWIDFSAERSKAAARRRAFRARYRPTGAPFEPGPGSLERFLTERYCLYVVEGRRVFRAEIHHPPFELQAAEAEIEEKTMAPAPITLRGNPLVHFSAGQDAVLWPLRQAEAARSDSASRK